MGINRFTNFLESIDLFSHPIKLKLKGNSRIKSRFGGLFSILVVTMVLIYTIDKLYQFKSPNFYNFKQSS